MSEEASHCDPSWDLSQGPGLLLQKAPEGLSVKKCQEPWEEEAAVGGEVVWGSRAVPLSKGDLSGERADGCTLAEHRSLAHRLLQVALLCGPPGLGKTTLAHVIAKHAGYNVVEMNAR